MNAFHLEGTEETLEITLSKERELFELKGVSLPENVQDFFQPIIDWIDIYMQDPLESTHITFNLEYFNTASSKYFLDILERLSELEKQKKKVFVHWVYDEDDEDIEEAGLNLQELTRLPFNFSPY